MRLLFTLKLFLALCATPIAWVGSDHVFASSCQQSMASRYIQDERDRQIHALLDKLALTKKGPEQFALLQALVNYSFQSMNTPTSPTSNLAYQTLVKLFLQKAVDEGIQLKKTIVDAISYIEVRPEGKHLFNRLASKLAYRGYRFLIAEKQPRDGSIAYVCPLKGIFNPGPLAITSNNLFHDPTLMHEFEHFLTVGSNDSVKPDLYKFFDSDIYGKEVGRSIHPSFRFQSKPRLIHPGCTIPFPEVWVSFKQEPIKLMWPIVDQCM